MGGVQAGGRAHAVTRACAVRTCMDAHTHYARQPRSPAAALATQREQSAMSLHR